MIKRIAIILLIILPIGTISYAETKNYRLTYALEAAYHIGMAQSYHETSRQLPSGSVSDRKKMDAAYHATMANNYLKLLDLRSSEKHSIDTDSRAVLESIVENK